MSKILSILNEKCLNICHILELKIPIVSIATACATSCTSVLNILRTIMFNLCICLGSVVSQLGFVITKAFLALLPLLSCTLPHLNPMHYVSDIYQI